jgi:hypothetical protein
MDDELLAALADAELADFVRDIRRRPGPSARRLALGAKSAVLSMDFRRAPESPWPAAVDDAVDAVRWAAEHRAELGGTRTRACPSVITASRR